MKKVLFSLLSVVMIALFLVSCAGGGGEEKPVVTSEKVPGYLQFVMPDGTRARFFGNIIDLETGDWINWMQNDDTLFNFDALNGPGDYFLVFHGYSVNDV